MLKEEEERGGAQQGGVMSVKLGFAELGGFVRGRLGGRVAGNRRKGGQRVER